MLARQLASGTTPANGMPQSSRRRGALILTSSFRFSVERALFRQLAPAGFGFFPKDLLISSEPARPLHLLVIHNASSEKPTKDACEQGTVRKKPLGVAKVINDPSGSACDRHIPQLDKRVRLQLAVGACFCNGGIMRYVVDDAIHAFDEGVRAIRSLVEHVGDNPPHDFFRRIRRQNAILQARVRQESGTLGQHLLAVLRSLKRSQCGLEIAAYAPTQWTDPLGYPDFREVIQPCHEPLFAGTSQLAQSRSIRARGNCECGRR
jgi:hypothetical protein